jgi:PAS domain S-box-containing protein
VCLATDGTLEVEAGAMDLGHLLLSKEFWAGLGAVGAAAAGIYKGFRVLRIQFHKVRMRFTQAGEVMDLVTTHLKRNGGSSLLDKVYNLEQASKARAERELLFHEDADFGYFLADGAGHFTRTSRTLCRMTGRTPNELAGFGWLNAVDPKQREYVLEQWTEALGQGREFVEPVLFRNADGAEVPVGMRAQPVVIDGKVSEWVGVIREAGGTPSCPVFPSRKAC